jgi:hypothetical protein
MGWGIFMRYIVILALLFLTGCAGYAERILNAQTASDKLRAELGADLDLQRALRRDISRKNAELEFVSFGTYSCGPDTADYQKVRVYDRNPETAREQAERNKKAKKGKEEFLRNKYADFETIMAYGDALSASIKDRDERVKAYANLKTLITNYKGFIPSEFALLLKVLNDSVGLAQAVDERAFQLDIVRIASFAEVPLQKARDRIVAKGIVKVLSSDEEKAFKEWDDCALDRLFFLREYNPPRPPSYLKRAKLLENTAGESRSPVLLFTAEFKNYLNEREAFVARRPDYIGLIDAILEQNKKLAHPTEGMSFNDVLTTLNQIGVDASNAKTQYEALRNDLSSI